MSDVSLRACLTSLNIWKRYVGVCGKVKFWAERHPSPCRLTVLL